MSVKILAPAKINIGLRVLSKKQSLTHFVVPNYQVKEGYHLIESIFQTINICDELEVSFLDSSLNEKNRCEVICSSKGLKIDIPKINTLTKTYNAFVKQTGKDSSVKVILTKNIPAGGGLGGGSSDGAYFLKALAKLNNVELTKELAFSVASEVGSDVFFFLGLKNDFGAALVSGRGEIVKEIESKKLHILVLFPDVFSSTKEAYDLLDAHYEENELKNITDDYLNFCDYEENYNQNICDWKFKNSFTSVLSNKYDEIKFAIDELKNAGADFVDMSGSGSTVFGIFEDENSLNNAFKKLISKNKLSKFIKVVLA